MLSCPSHTFDYMLSVRSDNPFSTLLPALPSKTKGPALFVGVIGPSCISISVVGVRKADSLKSSVPKRGCVGVIGRRNCTVPDADFEVEKFPAWENGGEILRAPRRVSRPGPAFAPFAGSDEVVKEGIEWLSSLTDRSLDVELDNPLSSVSIAISSCPGIISFVSLTGAISGLDSVPFSSSQLPSSGSSMSASKSVTARQFGHKNCGQDL